MIFDAHFHYAVCCSRNIFNLSNMPENWYGLSCAHSMEEWNIQAHGGCHVFNAFGIHPQLVGQLSKSQIEEYKLFLENLAATGKLNAIGEAGFDLFTEEFKLHKNEQEEIWNFQLEVAAKYKLPIVVHCRKANDKLFEYAGQLKKLPAVLFHSFMGSLVEAESLIKRNINCFFSFGKQMMNNNKKVIDCVINLPIENLLLETDGPFQTLKGEENTKPEDIITIYNAAWELRKSNVRNQLKEKDFEEFSNLIFNNGKALLSGINFL